MKRTRNKARPPMSPIILVEKLASLPPTSEAEFARRCRKNTALRFWRLSLKFVEAEVHNKNPSASRRVSRLILTKSGRHSSAHAPHGHPWEDIVGTLLGHCWDAVVTGVNQNCTWVKCTVHQLEPQRKRPRERERRGEGERAPHLQVLVFPFGRKSTAV